MIKRIIFFLILSGGVLFASANGAQDQISIIDNPKWDHHWFLDVTAGYVDFDFTNANLQSGFHAQNILTSTVGIRGELGYNFNRYVGLALSLMRGAQWVEYQNILQPGDQHSVWNSLFGLTLRPTLPLGKYIGLYGESGIGYISRHGFTLQGLSAIPSSTVVTGIFGGGLLYNVWKDLFIDWNTIYALPNQGQDQPQTWYTGLGIFYLLGSSSNDGVNDESAWFPDNFIRVDYMNKSLFDVHVPPLPIFFTSNINTKQGISFLYERNFFHTSKVFSLEMGASFGAYSSSQLGNDFYTVSLYPEVKIWMVRCPRFDFYFTYSLAGLSFMSRNRLDNQEMGSYFTFQDFFGIGTFLGKTKHLNLNLQFLHFSNGNLFPDNPGVDVPLMFGLGYAF